MPLRPGAYDQSIKVTAADVIINVECDGAMLQFFDKVPFNHLHEYSQEPALSFPIVRNRGGDFLSNH